MRHSLILCTIIIFNTIVSFAQNLVPNGDFEEYSDCNIGNNFSVPALEKAVPWFSPTEAMPDYFNRCSDKPSFYIPDNNKGYQEPFNGNGYAGFTFYYSNQGLDTEYEYIAVRLTHPLKVGRSYKMQFRLSLAEISTCPLEKIEVLFTDSPKLNVSNVNQSKISNESLLINEDDWSLFSISFVATTPADYLVIGNFEDLNGSDCKSMVSFGILKYVYLYIDDVSLVEENDYFLPNAFTPNEDGLNETFRPKGINQEPENYKLEVYNKWGKQVFETNNVTQGWDGTHAGEPLQQDVYVYKMSYEGFDQRVHQKSGRVTLLK